MPPKPLKAPIARRDLNIDTAKPVDRDADGTVDQTSTGAGDRDDDLPFGSPANVGRTPTAAPREFTPIPEPIAPDETLASKVGTDADDPFALDDGRTGGRDDEDTLREQATGPIDDQADDAGDGGSTLGEMGDGLIARRGKGAPPPKPKPHDPATSDRHVFDPDSDDPTQHKPLDELTLADIPLAPVEPPKPPKPPKGGKDDKKSMDPDDQDDLTEEEMARLGLDDFRDKVMPSRPVGGGITNPVDDFGTGSVTDAPTTTAGPRSGVDADPHDDLLGGDRRVGDFGSGAGNGGNGGTGTLGPVGPHDAGAIDFEDGAPAFDARADDPLASDQPTRDFPPDDDAIGGFGTDDSDTGSDTGVDTGVDTEVDAADDETDADADSVDA